MYGIIIFLLDNYSQVLYLINEYKRCSDIDVMNELKNPTVPSSTMTAPFGSLALDDTLI